MKNPLVFLAVAFTFLMLFFALYGLQVMVLNKEVSKPEVELIETMDGHRLWRILDERSTHYVITPIPSH